MWARQKPGDAEVLWEPEGCRKVSGLAVEDGDKLPLSGFMGSPGSMPTPCRHHSGGVGANGKTFHSLGSSTEIH